MDYGPMENLKENAKLTLGKRMNTTQQLAGSDSPEEQTGKKQKTDIDPHSIEAAGVSEHLCRAQ